MDQKLLTNYVRNPQGIWINSSVFSEEAKHFTKNGYYCADRPGTYDYTKYWDEQLRRCTEGYTVGGVTITGNHYNYLNFSPIQKIEKVTGKIAKKVTGFPDFWDGDYNYFHALDIARNGATREYVDSLLLDVKIENGYLNGGYHMVVGKARRKGYSFKNASICANTYNTVRRSLTIIGAFDKKFLYPKGTMGMASDLLSFYNKHTAWGKAREFVDKQDHKRSSFKEYIEGAAVESGFMSEIMAVSFGDNPDAARGKDAYYILFEEAGKFPNLIASVEATEAATTAGAYIVGQMVIFGTGGDMESGTTGFADIFYTPKQRGFMPFVNIWDKDSTTTSCGFFHPTYWNMDGFYDDQGNTDIDGALKWEENKREEIIKNSTSSSTINQRLQEFPTCPSEAFLTVSTNGFPTVELRNQYNKVIKEQLHIKMGQPVDLFREEGKVKARPILDKKVFPIWEYKFKENAKSLGLDGCPVIFEYPVEKPPLGLYKIGYDPYRHDKAEWSSSLGAIYVYKTIMSGSLSRNKIVAMYVGRPDSVDMVNRIAELFSELYNAEVMYENEVTHTKDHFVRRKLIHRLATQPNAVIAKAVNKSTVNRIYGMHMNEKIKDAGEKYLKAWLTEIRDYDQDGNALTNIDFIYDPGLLEELILYNRKGNFDRVIALMMILFQIADEEESKVYKEKKKEHKSITALKENMKKQFSKQ